MDFLSVINSLDVPDLKDVLQYNKTTKELTFISPEDGSKHTCYMNNMTALVNFMREYVVPIFQAPVENNVFAAFYLFLIIVGDQLNLIKEYIKLPISESGFPVNSSYTQWLKISIQAIQILDTLETTDGLWNGLLKVNQLDEGVYVRAKLVPNQPAHINWGDGEFTDSTDGSEVNHLYKAVGNYTITYMGKGLPAPEVSYQISGNGDYKGDSSFHFWQHQSLN